METKKKINMVRLSTDLQEKRQSIVLGLATSTTDAPTIVPTATTTTV